MICCKGFDTSLSDTIFIRVTVLDGLTRSLLINTSDIRKKSKSKTRNKLWLWIPKVEYWCIMTDTRNAWHCKKISMLAWNKESIMERTIKVVLHKRTRKVGYKTIHQRCHQSTIGSNSISVVPLCICIYSLGCSCCKLAYGLYWRIGSCCIIHITVVKTRIPCIVSR